MFPDLFLEEARCGSILVSDHILGGRLQEVRLYAEVNDVRCVRRSYPNLYTLFPNAFNTLVQLIYGADRKDRSLWEDNENL